MNKVFLALWDHKHGQDMRAFSTHEDAEEQLRQWAIQYVDEWTPLNEEFENQTPEELVSNWSEISCHTEFMTIETLDLN